VAAAFVGCSRPQQVTANAAPSGVAQDDDDLKQIDTSGLTANPMRVGCGWFASARGHHPKAAVRRYELAGRCRRRHGSGVLGRAEHPDLRSTGVMHRLEVGSGTAIYEAAMAFLAFASIEISATWQGCCMLRVSRSG
jgi:hypothetical protein